MAIPRKSSPDDKPVETKPALSTPLSTPVSVVSPGPVAGEVKAAVKISAADTTPATPSTGPEPRPVPHPAVAVPSQSTAPVSDDDLPSILRRLNPVQRAKLRSAAISEGLIQHSAPGSKDNSDGSISVVIRVDRDLVPQLRTWAEEAGKDLTAQIQEIVGMLLSSYLMSPWSPPEPVAAPVTAK